MAKTQADLDAAIAALPATIESAIDTALSPILTALEAKIAQLEAAGATVDFQPEVDALNAVAENVAAKVTTDLAPPAVAPPASAAPSGVAAGLPASI